MKISFIGNSHLGTIAPALSRNRGQVDVEHFISRTYGTVSARLVGTQGHVDLPFIKLKDQTQAGDTLNLPTTDVTVAVGLNFSLIQVAKLWEHFIPVDAQGEYRAPTLSGDLWNAYVDAAFDSTHMTQIVEHLRSLGAGSVIAVPAPAPAEWVTHREGESFALYQALLRNGDWARVVHDFARQVDRLADRGVVVFEQPSSTTNEFGFSLDQFAMGDPSDTSEGSFYSRGDFYHMNGAFGTVFAAEFYEWLDARVASREHGSAD